MPRLSKIGAAALAAFGWTTGVSAVSASYLVVAGGAGGGAAGGGGGGGGAAGGFRTGTLSLDPALSYTVTVGAGGAGGTTGQSGATGDGTSGSDSILSTITSTGGGGGGAGGLSRAGKTGGSGGGGGHTSGAGGAGNTPSTSPSQGNNGGTPNAAHNGGGGGGGASAVGATTPSAAVGGAGGAGTASSISGSSVTYAGGGGGASNTTGGAGGAGGGGTGGIGGGASGVAGTANLGGGGGGGYGSTGVAAAGGSGIVIISYVGAQQFGGGVVTSSGGNTIHTFTTSGTLVPVTPLSANYLVVAGGGGGGAGHAGGGGAGGLLTGSGVTIDSNSTYLVTVGAGGAGAVNNTTVSANGTNSTFSSFIAIGGGYGGGNNQPSTATINGNSGGSGGGGANSVIGTGTGGAGTSGQGFAGGSGSGGANWAGGGGGGASAVGANNPTVDTGGAGGAGTASSISGTSTYYAGGGGGGGGLTAGGAGGVGGGGAGRAFNAGVGGAGTANTGGGGGGARNESGGAGGSGIVIISYAGATQLMAGGTVTISGGNVIHTFTSSGYLTPLKYVNNSLRFRSSASAYLNRTPATTTNRRTWTVSLWIKRGRLATGTEQAIFGSNNGTTFTELNYLASSDILRVNLAAGSATYKFDTTAVFRDPAAWYHIVVAVDTTQATSTDRIKLYVNGVQQDGTNQVPVQNYDTQWNVAQAAFIGSRTASTWFTDGYLAEFYSIDGQALTPNSFGTFNSYGVWQPITYGGSYGTNGFYLPFSNTTSTTTLGYDFSPNGNNWTTNNISLTAGATYDSMTDVPTLTSATAANYATFNPLSRTACTITNGNLQAVGDGGNYDNLPASIAFDAGGSDGFYWEFTSISNDSSTIVGICSINNSELNKANPTFSFANSADGWGYIGSGNKTNSGTNTSYGNSWTNSDVIGVAVKNGKIWFSKNGTFQASGNPAAGTNEAFSSISGLVYPVAGINGTNGFNINFGQRPFSYTPPTGFVALNTFNL